MACCIPCITPYSRTVIPYTDSAHRAPWSAASGASVARGSYSLSLCSLCAVDQYHMYIYTFCDLRDKVTLLLAPSPLASKCASIYSPPSDSDCVHSHDPLSGSYISLHQNVQIMCRRTRLCYTSLLTTRKYFLFPSSYRGTIVVCSMDYVMDFL